MSEAAAKSGNLEMVKWLHSISFPWNEWTCSHAAGTGNLEILMWLHSAGCPWDEKTCQAAADGGFRETLQWAIDHGCPEPMDSSYIQRKSRLQAI
jgi:hypothetical protein